MSSLADLALSESGDDVSIPVRVIPRARGNALAGIAAGSLCVRLTAAPAAGAANEALLRFLADLLGVARRAAVLVAGAHSRRKIVRVRGLTATTVRERLAVHIDT